MNQIDSYRFGEMRIGGKSYRRDLIIMPDRIIDNWRRKEGHRLAIYDLSQITFTGIDCIIIGTGKFGMMKVDNEVVNYFNEQQVKVIILKTADAVQKYNEMFGEKRLSAAFHLTC